MCSLSGISNLVCVMIFFPAAFFHLGLTAALTGHSSATKTALQMSRLGHQARQMSVEFAIKKGTATAVAAAAVAAVAAERTSPTCLYF